jgi:hypothetical protein
MGSSTEQRACERIAIGHRVKVVPKGHMAACAMAVNISLGGLLLGAAPALPIGTNCEVAILLPGAGLGQAIKVTGTVVRSDANGTAIRFAQVLKPGVIDVVTQVPMSWASLPLIQAYSDYFQVSRSEDHTDCEALLGVSKGTLRTVFLSTFTTAIPLAILPVWLYRAAIPGIPNWEKVAFSFFYAAVWIALLQPTADVLILKFLRRRRAASAASR